MRFSDTFRLAVGNGPRCKTSIDLESIYNTMQDLFIIWLSLLACLAVIGFVGFRLSRYGDIIAEKSGLSRGWVALILLVTVTSLPELVTGLSAVTVARVPDIAVGDMMGSCMFNLLIIVLLDFLYRKKSVYTRARQGKVLSAGYGIALIGFAGFNLLLCRAGAMPSLGHVGLYTHVILLLYLLAMRSLYRYEKVQVIEYVEDRVELHPDMSLKQAVQGYALAAVAVMAVGIWLPFIARDLATVSAWEQSFVGTLFVAAVTSAPRSWSRWPPGAWARLIWLSGTCSAATCSISPSWPSTIWPTWMAPCWPMSPSPTPPPPSPPL
jgi:cation:H+ antiporter